MLPSGDQTKRTRVIAMCSELSRAAEKTERVEEGIGLAAADSGLGLDIDDGRRTSWATTATGLRSPHSPRPECGSAEPVLPLERRAIRERLCTQSWCKQKEESARTSHRCNIIQIASELIYNPAQAGKRPDATPRAWRPGF